MNLLPIEPTPNPEDARGQLPPLDTSPLPGFSSPDDPTADIGERAAANKALNSVGQRYEATHAKVIKSSFMSYKEARETLLEPIEADDPFLNTRVWVTEISGSFQRKGRSRFQKEGLTSTPTFGKAYIVLRAADGVLLMRKAIE